MDAEKQNNIQIKMQGHGAIPAGFHFQKTETWQKIENDLVDIRSKKLPLWKYAAAIVVLFAATFSFFLSQSIEIGKNIPSVIEFRDPASYINQENHTGAREKNIRLSYGREKKPLKKIESMIIAESKTVGGDSIQNIFTEAKVVETEHPLPADTSKALIVSKTKFKVAHINELNTQEAVEMKPSPSGNNLVFSLKRKKQETLYYESSNDEEKMVIHKKQKKIFSFISSSQ